MVIVFTDLPLGTYEWLVNLNPNHNKVRLGLPQLVRGGNLPVCYQTVIFQICFFRVSEGSFSRPELAFVGDHALARSDDNDTSFGRGIGRISRH